MRWGTEPGPPRTGEQHPGQHGPNSGKRGEDVAVCVFDNGGNDRAIAPCQLTVGSEIGATKGLRPMFRPTRLSRMPIRCGNDNDHVSAGIGIEPGVPTAVPQTDRLSQVNGHPGGDSTFAAGQRWILGFAGVLDLDGLVGFVSSPEQISKRPPSRSTGGVEQSVSRPVADVASRSGAVVQAGRRGSVNGPSRSGRRPGVAADPTRWFARPRPG